MKKKVITILAIFLFLSAYGAEISQQDVQRYSVYYSNGMEYLKNQQYSSAIVEFRKVLRFSPYDDTIKEALANAYASRAHYYRTTTKEITKALVDYKSAVFYAKFWSEENSVSMVNLANSAQKDIADFEKRLGMSSEPASKLHSAKILKAQGELAAAGYELQTLLNTSVKEEAYENLGNIYKNLNNLKMAMDYFKTAIDINPKNAKMHFLYGVMLDEAKNYEASMEQYNLALKYGDKSPELLEILENKWTQNIVNNPSDAQSYINLGAIYQKQGDLENAKAQYLKAQNIDSSDDTALYNLASLYVQKKEYLNAIGVYNKLLAKKADNIEVLNYKASAYMELKNYDEAIKQYEAILALQPENRDAKANYDNIVLNHFSGQKLQSFLLSKAQSNPTSYEAQFNCALEYHKNKNLESAIQFYKKALNVNPSKEETYINLAQIYLEQGKYDSAEQIAEKGLMLLPNSPELKKYLTDAKNFTANKMYDNATKLFNEKKYKEAINQYQKIPNKTKEVNMAIASCYWQMKDFKNANKFYQEILLSNPNDTEALVNSAYAYYSLNDIENAKQTAQRVLAINSTNTDAQNLIKDIESTEVANLLQEAILKYEAEDYTSASSLVNKYLSKNPNDEYGIYYKALCLDGLKKNSDAIKQYKQLISKNPNFVDAYYSLAVDYDNMENYKEAVVNYQKFVDFKKGAKDDMTKFAVERIKELTDYLNALNKK